MEEILVKLLIENWRKYINEIDMGFDMAKSQVYIR